MRSSSSILTRALMTTKQRLFVTEYIVSPFLPLVLFAVRDVWDCHSSFSCNKHDPFSALLFLFFLWPFGTSHVWFHSCALWRKREFVQTILVITILLTCCQYQSKRERIITILWVLVWCLLYSRHVRFTQKEQSNNHKVTLTSDLQTQT